MLIWKGTAINSISDIDKEDKFNIFFISHLYFMLITDLVKPHFLLLIIYFSYVF